MLVADGAVRRFGPCRAYPVPVMGGGWRIVDGRVSSGERWMASGGRRVAGTRCHIPGGRWQVASGRWWVEDSGWQGIKW